jgi:hypothetical protein
MEMSENIKELATALAKAQGKIDNVEKSKQAHNYKYADLGSCIEAIKQHFAEQELSVIQAIDEENGQKMLVTMILHSSGQWMRSKFSIESVVMKMCNSLQNLGAGITYARRYALCAMVNLAQEDSDAQDISKKELVRNSVSQEQEEIDKQFTRFQEICAEHKVDYKEFLKAHNLSSKSAVVKIMNDLRNMIIIFQRGDVANAR